MLDVFRQKPGDQVQSLLRYFDIDEEVSIIYAFLGLRNDLLVVIAEVGSFSGQQNVQHDSNRPYIRLLVVLLLVKDFWGHVEGSADDLPQLLALCELARSAEVYDLYILAAFKADVLWFDVPMDEALLVDVVNGREDLHHDLSGVFLAELLPLHDLVEELSALEQIHDQVEMHIVFVDLIELYYILVVHLL